MWDRFFSCENPSFDSLETDKCRSIYSFWQSQCDGYDLPDCSHLKPSDIAGFLSSVMMVDVEVGSFTDYRLMYRGSDLEDITADLNITDSIFHKPQYSDFVSLFDWVRQQKKPYFFKGVLTNHKSSELHALVMPFKHGTDSVKRLLLIMDRVAVEEALSA